MFTLKIQRLVATPRRTFHVADNKYRGLVRSPRYPFILRLAELAIVCKHFVCERKVRYFMFLRAFWQYYLTLCPSVDCIYCR